MTHIPRCCLARIGLSVSQRRRHDREARFGFVEWLSLCSALLAPLLTPAWSPTARISHTKAPRESKAVGLRSGMTSAWGCWEAVRVESFGESGIDKPRGQSARAGCGLLFRASGAFHSARFVLTAFHTVARASRIRVACKDGARTEFQVLACSPRRDVAILATAPARGTQADHVKRARRIGDSSSGGRLDFRTPKENETVLIGTCDGNHTPSLAGSRVVGAAVRRTAISSRKQLVWELAVPSAAHGLSGAGVIDSHGNCLGMIFQAEPAGTPSTAVAAHTASTGPPQWPGRAELAKMHAVPAVVLAALLDQAAERIGLETSPADRGLECVALGVDGPAFPADCAVLPGPGWCRVGWQPLVGATLRRAVLRGSWGDAAFRGRGVLITVGTGGLRRGDVLWSVEGVPVASDGTVSAAELLGADAASAPAAVTGRSGRCLWEGLVVSLPCGGTATVTVLRHGLAGGLGVGGASEVAMGGHSDSTAAVGVPSVPPSSSSSSSSSASSSRGGGGSSEPNDQNSAGSAADCPAVATSFSSQQEVEVVVTLEDEGGQAGQWPAYSPRLAQAAAGRPLSVRLGAVSVADATPDQAAEMGGIAFLGRPVAVLAAPGLGWGSGWHDSDVSGPQLVTMVAASAAAGPLDLAGASPVRSTAAVVAKLRQSRAGAGALVMQDGRAVVAEPPAGALETFQAAATASGTWPGIASRLDSATSFAHGPGSLAGALVARPAELAAPSPGDRRAPVPLAAAPSARDVASGVSRRQSLGPLLDVVGFDFGIAGADSGPSAPPSSGGAKLGLTRLRVRQPKRRRGAD